MANDNSNPGFLSLSAKDASRQYTREEIRATQAIAKLVGVDCTSEACTWNERGLTLDYMRDWRKRHDSYLPLVDLFIAHGLCPVCCGRGNDRGNGCESCKGTGLYSL